MENLQATGTLSVAIDTTQAEASLTRLEGKLAKLGGQGSVASIAADTPETLRKMQMLEAEVQVLTDRLQKNGQARESMSRVTRSWSAAEGAARLSMRESTAVTTDQIKAMATAEKAAKELARAKNQVNNLELRVIAAEEAGKLRDAEKAAKELARAKNQANALELRVIAAEEAKKLAEASRAAKELASTKNQANSLELRVIAAEEAKKLADAAKATRELARAKDQVNRLELRVIAAEEAGKVKAAERAAKELARAKDQANKLELRVIAAEEAKKLADATKAAKELARAKDQVNRLELRVIAAEEAGKIRAAEKATKELARAKDQANRLELRAIAAEEARKLALATKEARELARAKDQANRLELRVIRDEEIAKLKAATRAANELRAATARSISYQAATPAQRATTNLKAGIALAAGADTSGYAAEAVAAARAAGSVDALRAAQEKLTGGSHALVQATHAVSGGMQELHTGARGVAGAFGQLWMTYGSLVPLLTGAAIGAAFKSTLSKGADFEYQLTFVKALGGESAAAVERLSAAALDLGKNGLYGPIEVAEGMRILAQAGLNAEEQLKAISSVLDLSTVGEMGVDAAAETLAGVSTAFGKSKDEFRDVGDIFAKAAAISQTSVTGLTESMKYASVVGEQYGVSLEDTATALALLAKMNITGTSAGTAFRNMVKELYAPTAQAAGVMKQIGMNAKDASGNLRPMADILYDLKDKLQAYDKGSQTNILQALFGERGGKEAVAMLSLTREEWNKLRSEVEDSRGFMGSVAAELEATTSGTMKQAFNTLQTSLIEVFNTSKYGMAEIAADLKTTFASEGFKQALAGLVEALSLTIQVVFEYKETLLGLAAVFVGGKLISGVAALGAGLTAYAAQVTLATATTGAGTAALAALAGVIGPMVLPVTLLAGAFTGLYLALREGSADVPNVSAGFERINSALDRQLGKINANIDALQERNRLLLSPAQAAAEDKDKLAQMLGVEDAKVKTLEARLAKQVVPTPAWENGVTYSREGEAILKELTEARKSRQKVVDTYNATVKASFREAEAADFNKYIAEAKRYEKTAEDVVTKLRDTALKSSGSRKGELNALADSIIKAGTEKDVLTREELVKKANAALDVGTKSFTMPGRGAGNKDSKGENQRYDDDRILKELSEEQSKLDAMLDGGETLSSAQRKLAELSANLKDGRLNFKNAGTRALVDAKAKIIQERDEEWRSKSKAKEDATNQVDKLQNQFAEEQDVVKRHEAALEREYSVGAIVAQEYYTRLAAMRAKAYEDQVAVYDKELAALREYQAKWTKPDTVEFKEYDRKIENVNSKRRRLDTSRGAEQDQLSFDTWKATDLSPMRGIVDAMREIRNSAMDLASTFKDGLKGSLDIAANGFVNLAITGKMSVRGMVSDMLTYLAKLAANKAFMMIASFALNAAMPTPSYNGWDGAQGSGGMYQANGGAWNQGVQAFAKGGTFTNTVVDSPTLFKFAKGTGLMGEAGPEAIMPLKRDANGRLGVSAMDAAGSGGGSVVITQHINVVVEGKGDSGKQQGDDIAAALGPQLKGMIMSVIVDQKRPGGLLS